MLSVYHTRCLGGKVAERLSEISSGHSSTFAISGGPEYLPAMPAKYAHERALLFAVSSSCLHSLHTELSSFSL